MSIAVITANLGGFDKPVKHVPQSIKYDSYNFNDKNFPLRDKAMTPRLQAKVPKLFGWELIPKHDYYMWLDANLALAHEDSLKFFLDNIQGYDLLVLRHPRRPNIRQEVRYTRKGINQQSRYIVGRYNNEWHKEQHRFIDSDKDFVDDLLVNGGVFMYKDTPEIREMFKEWWFHISRYIIQDQISFPYVIKKSGIKYKVLDIIYDKCVYLKHTGHIHHDK